MSQAINPIDIATFQLDPQVEAFGSEVYNTPLIQDVWKKYLWPAINEQTPQDVYRRVAQAIAHSEVETSPEEAEAVFYQLMNNRLFVPGGRILAGAGTSKRVTLMNCFVNSTIEDSMEGIMHGVSKLALTSQQGGGMGTAFETIRPKNAILTRTQSAASGVLPFMDVYNQTGKTIRSAGDRRAAQMGTISDTHPDMPEFIQAKGQGLMDGTKRLAEFNISVLVTDTFKAAIEDDVEWPLYFHIPPKVREPHLETYDFEDDNGTYQYVYAVWQARDLWRLITENTYKFSDPGVIFIDRVNDWNNLGYIEEIRCTNPCGEQPLPPDGTCNLGAINVANCIRNPFTSRAEVDYELIAAVARQGIRFLDNVINVTGYPLPEQQEEEYNKRRVGLGLLGLGTAFSELCIRYGSQKSVEVAERIMKTICLAAYDMSIELAEKRGSFPLFQDIIIDYGFIKYRLDDERKEAIKTRGLRNGVLLNIAPVGTGSIATGNPSSGCEPDFAHEMERNVRQNNAEEWKKYTEESYTKRFYRFVTGRNDIPDYMVTAHDIDILDHIKIQGALQKWVDASISKTINIPEDLPYDKFVEVYDLAWMYSCKGCTTYRPSQYRESILAKAGDGATPKKIGRPETLTGTTYKIKWPSLSSSMFVTINYSDDGRPYEIFFASKDAKFQDWMTGLTLMISAILRSDIDPSFIPHELKQVVSTHDTSWIGGKHYGSLVAKIGAVIEDDFVRHGIGSFEPTLNEEALKLEGPNMHAPKYRGDLCPSCRAPTLIHKEGCKSCASCGYSQC